MILKQYFRWFLLVALFCASPEGRAFEQARFEQDFFANVNRRTIISWKEDGYGSLRIQLSVSPPEEVKDKVDLDVLDFFPIKAARVYVALMRVGTSAAHLEIPLALLQRKDHRKLEALIDLPEPLTHGLEIRLVFDEVVRDGIKGDWMPLSWEIEKLAKSRLDQPTNATKKN